MTEELGELPVFLFPRPDRSLRILGCAPAENRSDLIFPRQSMEVGRNSQSETRDSRPSAGAPLFLLAWHQQAISLLQDLTLYFVWTFCLLLPVITHHPAIQIISQGLSPTITWRSETYLCGSQPWLPMKHRGRFESLILEALPQTELRTTVLSRWLPLVTDSTISVAQEW